MKRHLRQRMSDMATCHNVGRVLQTYLDSELNDEVRARRVATHLEACRRCGLEAETYRALKQALGSARAKPDPGALTRLRMFAERLVETGLPPAEAGPSVS